MKERKVLTKALAGQYRKAPKKGKGQILDSFVEATGYNRSYASRLLRNHGRRVHVGSGVWVEGDAGCRVKRPRARVYGPKVVKALKKVWEILDYINSKRLEAALPEVVPRLVKFGELRISKEVQEKLMRMSASTIDRVLKGERARYVLKGRARTKPGTLLKHQVPIRTFSDWEDVEPGFVEMDLVAHDGGKAEGDYCHTLDVTDVATAWTEQAAVLNKAQVWVFEALEHLRERLPFPVRGLDSDNGSEFINKHLVRYCKEEDISFTRSRPYRKNDTCYVEQKNWSVVRRCVGYGRYQGERACRLLNDLYEVLRDYNNFFLPTMKLQEKTRDGARVHRRYERAKTPYQRVLESPTVSEVVKKRVGKHYKTLNPAALQRRICRLREQLEKIAGRTPWAVTVAVADGPDG
jgi:hypothetical protein